ncbi:MAG TPA: YbaK/EbsC family protein [Acidimicrobiales bacterium]
MIGTLTWLPARSRPDLLAEPVAAALAGSGPDDALVAEIDPGLADTAAFCAAYEVPPEVSANCVVLAARRAGATALAACVVLATTRADVNRRARHELGARKASFAAVDDAVAATGMEYGGITPVGLPAGWTVLVDAAVAAADRVVVGSGLRRSKLLLPGPAVAALPGARAVEGLGLPATG